MEKFLTIKSVAAPWLLPNVDTDIITPMKRMLNNADTLARYAFEAFRYVDGDGEKGVPNPDFVLNQEKYRSAAIMIVGDNFGCGSSRETAPAVIAELGVRCLIGTSFGGIFHKNCFQRGILPVVLSPEDVDAFAMESEAGEFTVSLETMTVTSPSGHAASFRIGQLNRQLLMQGLDNLGLTMTKLETILSFAKADAGIRPWIYGANLHVSPPAEVRE